MPTHLCMLRFIVACHFLEAGVSHATSPLINKTLPFNASDANSQPTTNTTGSTVSSHMYTNTTNSVGLPQRQVGRKELAQMRSIAQWLLHLGPSVRQSSMQINTSRNATPSEGIARKPFGKWKRTRRRRPHRPHRRPQPNYSGRQQDAPAITTSATPNTTPTAGSTNNVKNAPSAATTATVAPSTWTTTTSTPEYAGQKIRIRPISTLSSGGQLPGGQSYVNVSTPVETTPSARDSTSIIAGTTITTATPTAAAVTTTTATTSTRSATIAAATTTATTSITVTVIGYSTTITNTNATTTAQTTSAAATSTNATPTTTIVTTTTATTAIATIAATSTTTTTTTSTAAPAPAPANANPTVTPNATSNTTIVAAKPTIVIAIKKRIEAPSSSPVPPASPTIAPVGDPRKINVSVTTIFAIRINDFHVGTMLEATREQAMARVMESALGKIGHSNFTSNHIGLVSTSRMLREQATLNEPSVPDSQAASVNASQRSNTKVIVGIARWYPCGFGRRRCTSPDMCVHSDNGTICALREDNPPPNTSNFIAYWASALSVDCRCVSMIDGDLHATKFPLGAKLGPPPKRGRLSSIEKRFPRCKYTCGMRLADKDGLHCWCGVEFLICHPLQSCLEHAEHPHLSRCGSPAEILPWARTKNWKACPADEDKVYEGKELCACRTKRVYCIRGQRCLHNSKQGPPACQSPYNQCPASNEPSTEDVCYCKWRACAYGEMCIIDDQKPACVPHNQKLCPRWYHQTELTTMACKDNTLCDFADKCWWWGCGFMRVNWCPRDWPFMCFNAMCVAHPDLCTRYGGLRKCPCNDETTEIPVGASSDLPVTAPSGNDLRLLGSTSAILGGDQRRAQLRRMKGINDFDIAENKGDNSLLLDAILASIFGTDQWTAWRRRMQQNNEGDNKCACASAPLENNDIRSCVCAMATGKRPKSWSGDVDTSVTAGTAIECNSCSDKQKNGDESDVDCGGSFCTPCDLCFFHTKCERHLLGNLECDAHCNTAACGFDGGDCNEINQGQCHEKGCEEKQKKDGVCNEECDIVECDNDGGDCLRRGCTDSNASNYDRDAILEDDSCHYDGARPGGGAASKNSLCSQLITRRVCVFYVNCHWDRVKNECSESPGENHTISLQWFSDALYLDLRAQKWATSPTGYVQTYHVTTHFDVLVTEEEANSCLGLTAYNGKRTFNAALWEALTSEVAEALSDTHDGIAEVMAAYSTCFDRRLLDQEPSPLFHGMLGALLGVVTAAAVNTLHFCFGSHHTLKYRMDIDRQPWDSTQSGQWRVSVICEV